MSTAIWKMKKGYVTSFKKIRHEHDWETVTDYSILDEVEKHPHVTVHRSKRYGFCSDSVGYARFEWKGERVDLCYSDTRDTGYKKVCLTCGECTDTGRSVVKYVIDKITDKVEENKEAIRRKNLAKKLWNENCTGKENN